MAHIGKMSSKERKRSDYDPSPEDSQLIQEVELKFDQWREARRPHEIQWFLNAAMIRGLQYVNWNGALGKLDVKDKPSKRIRLVVNRIRPKLRAKMAKATKERPRPLVIPASTDREDKLNARATQKVLDYLWRKQNLERKHIDALAWAQIAGKGFWWFYWDSTAQARVKVDTPMGPKVGEAPLGDVQVEVGSPFEFLPSDPGLSYIGDQPEIMRVKLRDVEDVRLRYPELAKYLEAEFTNDETFHYERQIAQMTARGVDGVAANEFDRTSDVKGKPTHVMVKELFTKPSGRFPKGRHVVVAAGVLLKNESELPFENYNSSNPYPCVEFADTLDVGQFWPVTLCEQLIGPQKEYNNLRSKLAEHLRLVVHPKLLVPVQCNVPDNAWNANSGEIVRFQAFPGLPVPQAWNPPNILGDAWRALELVKSEFDELSGLYPAAMGGVGNIGESGFQTNLLQEAVDSIHALDIRLHELALEDASRKLRRIIAMGYDIPRLISVAGRNYEPDVFEVSSSQIDENAEIIIHTTSALSASPAVKTKQILELFNSGVLGDVNDPDVKRRTLGVLDLGELASYEEFSRRDEEQARLENMETRQGLDVEFPKPWENHDIHYAVHTDDMKAPDFKNWPDEARVRQVAHVVMHVKFIDPNKAVMIAQEFGLVDLIPLILPQQSSLPTQAPPPGAPPQEPPMPPPGMPPGPPEMPPPGMAQPMPMAPPLAPPMDGQTADLGMPPPGGFPPPVL